MKKKLLKLFILIIGLNSFWILSPHPVKAENLSALNQIKITQFPSKLKYTYGENLDLDGLVVMGIYDDGSSSIISDYSVTGFKSKEIGAQKIIISYQNHSDLFDVTVNPVPVKLGCKAGDKKIRLTWSMVVGASSYDIYMGNNSEGTGYSYVATNEGNDNCSYIVNGLETGDTYYFYAIARHKDNGGVFESVPSNIQEVTLTDIKDTNTSAKYFNNLSDFKASSAFKNFPIFGANVDASKSIIIPGLITTNVGGFVSRSMCPQGITFAGDYFFISAYDKSAEENSVIYMIDKNTKEFVKTLVLPYKYHVGGICYDGSNLWITTGTKVSAISLSEILDAIKVNESYAEIYPKIIYKLGFMASYITYYNNKLWIGTYDKCKLTDLSSYTITNNMDGLVLTKTDTMIMPTRVQGITFTNDDYFIVSRSRQFNKEYKGYIHRIEVYKPYVKDNSLGNLSLGNVLNYVNIPYMNEGVALDGDYLFINFESGAYPLASDKMDHVCALYLSSVLNKE